MDISFSVDEGPVLGGSVEAARRRLVDDDVLGQLLERRGRMAELATEGGDVKLDWVDEVAWALAHPGAIQAVESLAEELRRGSATTDVIWSGMGGSVQAVRALGSAGWLAGSGLRVHPMDSTDPRALERLSGEIGRAGWASTAMVAVSMGMTSEEPVAHLEWFRSVLEQEGIADISSRLLVMSLPGSMLSTYAAERGIRRVGLQPDEQNHIPGRMSAPSTKVFQLPVALALGHGGGLAEVLARCQGSFVLEPGLAEQDRRSLLESDPFASLACWLGAALAAGRDMVCLETDELGRSLAPWVEQVVEESLCKAGRGVLTFYDQRVDAPVAPQRLVRLQLRCKGAAVEEAVATAAGVPAAALELRADEDPVDRFALGARFFSGWNLVVALVGYLGDLVFAGQPGVEGYKRYARELRDAPGDLPFPTSDLVADADGSLRLWFGPLEAAGLDLGDLRRISQPSPGSASQVAAILAEVVLTLRAKGRLAYLDLTINGDPLGGAWDEMRRAALRLGNETLGVPTKIRSGPRDYHSTEQSQVDGPNELLSIRVAVEGLPTVGTGSYDERFFHAQTLGTVLAMKDAGRPVLLAMLRSDSDAAALVQVLDSTGALVRGRAQ